MNDVGDDRVGGLGKALCRGDGEVCGDRQIIWRKAERGLWQA